MRKPMCQIMLSLLKAPPLPWLACTLLLLATSGVRAADWHLSGFGSVGVSCFTADLADYTQNELPTGPGASGRCDAGLDSKIGAQLDWDVAPRLTATAQVTVYRRADNSWLPELTLANLQWRFNNALSLRIGRLQNPNFLFSEYRNVHYAQPWARPPVEVYGLATTFLHDGAELRYETTWGGWNAEAQLGVAYAALDISDDYERLTHELAAQPNYLVLSLTQEPWLFKLGLSLGTVSFEPPILTGFFNSLRTSGYGALASRLDLHHDFYGLFSVGARYDDGTWLALAEIAHRHVEGYARSSSAGYLTLGRHFGDWMPYVTGAHLVTYGPYDDATIARGVHPLLDELANNTDLLLRQTRQNLWSLALGTRWALAEPATLKLQVDLIWPGDGSFGLYSHRLPGWSFTDHDMDTLWTLNLDFVF